MLQIEVSTYTLPLGLVSIDDTSRVLMDKSELLAIRDGEEATHYFQFTCTEDLEQLESVRSLMSASRPLIALTVSVEIVLSSRFPWLHAQSHHVLHFQ